MVFLSLQSLVSFTSSEGILKWIFLQVASCILNTFNFYQCAALRSYNCLAAACLGAQAGATPPSPTDLLLPALASTSLQKFSLGHSTASAQRQATRRVRKAEELSKNAVQPPRLMAAHPLLQGTSPEEVDTTGVTACH